MIGFLHVFDEDTQMSRQSKIIVHSESRNVFRRSLFRPIRRSKSTDMIAQGLRRPRFSFFRFTLSKSTAPKRQKSIQPPHAVVDKSLADLISHIHAEHPVEPRAKHAAASGGAALVVGVYIPPSRRMSTRLLRKVGCFFRHSAKHGQRRENKWKSASLLPRNSALIGMRRARETETCVED